MTNERSSCVSSESPYWVLKSNTTLDQRADLTLGWRTRYLIWRYSARELLGLSAYQNEDLRAAEDQFSALLVDAGTPRNMRDRANVMLALIVSQTATEGGSDAPDAKSDEAKSDDAKSDDAEATTN